MSAETLRKAAALMRERAVEAIRVSSRDLWMDMAALDPDNNGWVICEQRQPDVDWDTTVATLPHDYEGLVARHIAPWHPVVAVAVADWLEVTASRWGKPGHRHWHAPEEAALAVATAYLGGVA